jgi:hypothetical protein
LHSCQNSVVLGSTGSASEGRLLTCQAADSTGDFRPPVRSRISCRLVAMVACSTRVGGDRPLSGARPRSPGLRRRIRGGDDFRNVSQSHDPHLISLVHDACRTVASGRDLKRLFDSNRGAVAQMKLQRRESSAIHELDDVVGSHPRLPFLQSDARGVRSTEMHWPSQQ